MGGRRLTDQQIADALRKSLGIQAAAARKLGCSRDTVCVRVKKSPMLQAVIANEYERRVDIAESALFKAVASGEPWAVRFTLQVSPYGRKRGYAEQTDVNVRTSPAANLSTEEIERIIREKNERRKEDGGEKAVEAD